MDTHDYHMLQCISLAMKGGRFAAPNPMVGSVIVCNHEVIGKGYHEKFGGPHAEVNAINDVKNKELLKQSTLYVNLEPCSHYGKTPPCADLIIDTGIKRVVIGTTDPNPKVAGKGIKKLIDAGIEVHVGVRERECEELNHRFFTFIRKNRPYIILKWAQSMDGFIAPENQDSGQPTIISNSEAQILVHQWRSEEQAILVGANTIIKDNPQLNVRLVDGISPQIIILGNPSSIPPASRVLKSQPLYIPSPGNLIHLSLEKGYLSVFVEGGLHTLQSFLEEGLWDEARVIINPKLQLKSGIKAPVLNQQPNREMECGNNLIKFYHHG